MVIIPKQGFKLDSNINAEKLDKICGYGRKVSMKYADTEEFDEDTNADEPETCGK